MRRIKIVKIYSFFFFKCYFVTNNNYIKKNLIVSEIMSIALNGSLGIHYTTLVFQTPLNRIKLTIVSSSS